MFVHGTQLFRILAFVLTEEREESLLVNVWALNAETVIPYSRKFWRALNLANRSPERIALHDVIKHTLVLLDLQPSRGWSRYFSTKDLREVSSSLGVAVFEGVFTNLCPFLWRVAIVLASRHCNFLVLSNFKSAFKVSIVKILFAEGWIGTRRWRRKHGLFSLDSLE